MWTTHDDGHGKGEDCDDDDDGRRRRAHRLLHASTCAEAHTDSTLVPNVPTRPHTQTTDCEQPVANAQSRRYTRFLIRWRKGAVGCRLVSSSRTARVSHYVLGTGSGARIEDAVMQSPWCRMPPQSSQSDARLHRPSYKQHFGSRVRVMIELEDGWMLLSTAGDDDGRLGDDTRRSTATPTHLILTTLVSVWFVGRSDGKHLC